MRNVPYDMLLDMQRGCTTLCVCIRFDPSDPDAQPYFVTGLDQDVVYDDLTGEQTYLARIGMESSTTVKNADLSINGGEVSGLMPVFDTPISEADIISGRYDFGTYTAYLVDYTKLTPGRHVILDHGPTGRYTVTDGGLAFLTEIRSLAQNLRQSLTEKWSLGCRATFGSQPGGVDRYPCMFDAEALWEAGTVATVGLESNRTFTTSGLAPAYGGVPGMVRWLTGANAGRTYEVEGFTDVAGVQTIDLTFPTMFPISVDDDFEFRDDCPKTEEACKARGNYQWMRAEPKIPVGDAGQMSVPGASAGVGTGAVVTTEYQPE